MEISFDCKQPTLTLETLSKYDLINKIFMCVPPQTEYFHPHIILYVTHVYAKAIETF